MLNSTAYVVRPGDTLWELAQKYLGDANRWPEIWHFNNKRYSSPTVRANMKPSMYIKDPDLIFVGQKLLLPTATNRRQAVTPKPKLTGKSRAKNKVRLVPFKYDLSKQIFETHLPGGFKATVAIKGSITIQSEKTIGWAEFNKSGMEVKVAKEYETPLNKLVSQFQLGINEKTKQIDFSCGVTIHSKTKFSPKYEAKMSLNPLTGMPVYKTTISYPEIKGKLNQYFYTTNGYSVSIEIEKEPDARRMAPQPIPVPVTVPQPDSDWWVVAGTLLLVGAAAVVVVTIVEDIITLGAGIADDPASFALAATMATRGMALVRGTKVAVTQLTRVAPAAGFAH